MKGSTAWWSVVAVAGLLAACGQKGPLVLPDAAKPKRTMPSLPGLRRAPAATQPPVTTPPPTPSQAPIDAAPVPQAPVTPATTNPR